MTSEEYEFRIDAFSPSSIPMARLALYMTELASLLGNSENVHFGGIKKGSVRVFARVAHEAAPKVRVRLNNARDPTAPPEVRKHYRKIDDLLRMDNAVGTLKRGKSNVIAFPGRKGAKSSAYGPFTEPSTMDGIVVRVGGADDTAHILIENQEKKVSTAECSRELAVRLAPHLYKPVRLAGMARWVRDEFAEWRLLHFAAKDFVVLSADDLAAVLTKVRERFTDETAMDGEGVEELLSLRGGT